MDLHGGGRKEGDPVMGRKTYGQDVHRPHLCLNQQGLTDLGPHIDSDLCVYIFLIKPQNTVSSPQMPVEEKELFVH